jgi:hypothetical protein
MQSSDIVKCLGAWLRRKGRRMEERGRYVYDIRAKYQGAEEGRRKKEKKKAILLQIDNEENKEKRERLLN